jgi:glycosyltransferase involved in cell wall biosynthesis
MTDKTISQDGRAQKILAIIPAYNESERVANVVHTTMKFLQVLVIDDGSKDETSRVAREAGAEVIRQEPNQGKGVALLKGFKYGLDHGVDAIITLDADGQHDAAEIPLFIEDFTSKGSDLIIGMRDFSKMPFPRNITNRIGTWSFSNAMQQNIPDNQSGYRLHSRRLIEEALSSAEHGFEFEVEIILRCVLKGYQISWIPIKTIYNQKQNSKITPIRHVWRFYRLVARTRKIIREYKRSFE